MKKTRKMVASLVAIVICFAMLLGTTYAWFTDSVVNTNNIIKSGNVDVELWHKSNENTSFEEVDGATKLFVNTANDPILWEPEASTTETFKVSNVGSLALKYNFSVKAIAKSLNAVGRDLTDVITVTVNEQVQSGFDFAVENQTLEVGKSATYKINLKWNQGVLEDKKYENLQILLGVELVATQDYVEVDGSGNPFDGEAQFPNASNMADLTNDVTEDVTLVTAGENAVEVSLPKDLVNQLSAEKISLVHTEPKVEGDKVIFDAIELVDEDGNTIDLSDNDKEFKITLPAQEKFNAGAQVSIYHDGENVATATVADDKTITYTVKHLCEVAVGPVWNGTADTAWYNDTDTEFTLESAEQFAGLAELVDGGNTFEGKTIKLSSNINLGAKDENGTPISFDPIGDKAPFNGTFDGQGHTIANMYQSGWAFGYEWGSYGSIGLFGEINNATIKNVTVSGADSYVEGGDVGGVVGCATGNCLFENITIENSNFGTFNNGIGGIIGWSGAGEYTFKNIKIAEDVVLGGLWGSFDSSIGGVVGQAEPGATYNFENVEISCRIDAYNDCTASYDYYNYRMCGMIIGRCEETTTIDGINYPDLSKYNLTFNNVTVNYGDWMNYHYCDPTPGLNGGRGMRVEAGYAYDGLPADYDHSQCTTHHMECIPFDQLIGGDQLDVKGLSTLDGVTVNYPESYENNK